MKNKKGQFYRGLFLAISARAAANNPEPKSVAKACKIEYCEVAPQKLMPASVTIAQEKIMERKLVTGVLFALSACFIWGLIFIIPTFLQEFDSIEIALGRHSVYGFISLCILLIAGRQAFHYPLKAWLTALGFALIANVFCYCCIVTGVTCASPSLAALVLGLSPIAISLYGNWVEREFSYSELIVPAILIFIGLLLINLPALEAEHLERNPHYFVGVLAAFGSLASWSWFVVTNTRFLRNNPAIPSAMWSTLLGSATFFWVCLLGITYESWHGIDHWQKFLTPSPALQNYLIGSLILGIVCSWFGIFLWNSACKRIPISFAGELTIFETLFGLLFFYVLRQEFPPLTEIAGVLCMLSAIAYRMIAALFSKPAAAHQTRN